jgi:TIR domain
VPFLYELAVLGSPTESQLENLRALVAAALGAFRMSLGSQVGWAVRPDSFDPEQTTTAAAVYFGGAGGSDAGLEGLRRRAVPILPVVSDLARVQQEIPEVLRPLNCLDYRQGGAQRVATALLECCGLLPRQRRVFLSYRRDEARTAAVQLFDELSARGFDVFLDTHGVAPAADFQTTLWHRLCDSNVLIMLDTPNYFASRWTNAEFGRALAKDIAVLRIGWPDATPSPRTATASRAELTAEEIDLATGRLADNAVSRICSQLETVRSESHAVRLLNLVSNLRIAIEKIGGRISGVGLHNGVHLRLPDGAGVIVYPAVGVPTSTTMHDAATNTGDHSAAVVYDPVGLDPRWLDHMDCG